MNNINNKNKNKNNKLNQKGKGSDWTSTLYSRGPVNTPDMPTDVFKQFTTTAEDIKFHNLSTQYKGGANIYNKLKVSELKKLVNSKTNNMKKTDLINILQNGYKNLNQKGKGSDWISTVYTRGPVNTPDMSTDQFKQFTTSAEDIKFHNFSTQYKGGKRIIKK